MSKQPPAELAAEQSDEIGRWMAAIDAAHTTAIFKADYATIAHLHRKLAGVMREYQKSQKKQETLQAEVFQHMIDEADADSSHTQDMTVR